MRRLAVFLGALFASMAVAQSLVDPNRPSDDMGIDQKLGAELPLDTPFLDEDGKSVKLGDYFGKKPVLVQLLFYRCAGTCTQMLDGGAEMLKDMKATLIGRDFEYVIISIHPEEKPDLAIEKKEAYIGELRRPRDRGNETELRQQAADKGWHFLTGTEANILKVSNAIGYRFVYDKKADRIAHPSGLFIATPSGKMSMYYFGVQYPTKFVQDSIMAASREHIGEAVPKPILLGCMSLDPRTGRLTMNVLRTMQVGGLITVLVLVASIGWMSRRKGRQDGPPSLMEDTPSVL
ncbi:MAG: hypothetical protein HONBIEJF_01267 [Fimbriimonadaceae bacterium]|nr:hypothetical protein [Fimbriimonadaceae bacterium]